jgi:hypothetical protein
MISCHNQGWHVYLARPRRFENSHAPVVPSAGPLVRFRLLTRICATPGYPGEVSGHKGQRTSSEESHKQERDLQTDCRKNPSEGSRLG